MAVWISFLCLSRLKIQPGTEIPTSGTRNWLTCIFFCILMEKFTSFRSKFSGDWLKRQFKLLQWLENYKSKCCQPKLNLRTILSKQILSLATYTIHQIIKQDMKTNWFLSSELKKNVVCWDSIDGAMPGCNDHV